MKLTTILFFVCGLVLGAGGVYVWQTRTRAPTASAGTLPAADPIRAASALGRIQPAGGVISIGVFLPDQLAKLHVEEGRDKDVEAGDPLAELASRKDRQLELDLLDQQIKEAKQKLGEIDRTGPLQLALDKLQLQQAEEQGPLDVTMQKLKADFLHKQARQAREGADRLTELTSVSRQEKDQQELAAQQSEAEHAGAVSLLKKLELGQSLSVKLAQAKMDLTEATLQRTRKEVPLLTLDKQRTIAANRLDQTILKAPSRGRILKTFARPGELVGPPQPILLLADLSKMAVIAEVYETDVARISVGQTAIIKSKVESAAKMKGKVASIARMVGKNRVTDGDPLADVDRRTVEVKVLLDDPEPAARLINLQVNVFFEPRD
jgi:HlyD family secretion protein